MRNTSPFPGIISHSDSSEGIDAVGQGVNGGRGGQLVWMHGAQPYLPFGTEPQLTVVPADQAGVLPDNVDDGTGASWGFPDWLTRMDAPVPG